MAQPDNQDVPVLHVGYTTVDAQPNATRLIEGMDQTARWDAVKLLRAWERPRLALQPGERLIDVGCGPGDVAIALSAEVGPTGAVLGVDASDVMVTVARQRAAESGSSAEFRVENAQSLTVGDGVMDACRSERMLQWVPDANRAIVEMVRVLRPGGRLVVTDTDWRSMVFDLPEPQDAQIAELVAGAMRALRGPGHSIGGRLLNIFRELGLVDLDCTAATHVWTEWDPDREPGPSGFFPVRTVIPQLADQGLVDRAVVDRFIAAVEDAGRGHRYCAWLTMFSVYGRKPLISP